MRMGSGGLGLAGEYNFAVFKSGVLKNARACTIKVRHLNLPCLISLKLYCLFY